MTKDQLHLAQMLHSTYEKAEEHADRLDPDRKHEGDIVRLDPDRKHEGDIVPQLEAIATHASRAFMALTRKHPSTVKFFELSTVDPADSAREDSRAIASEKFYRDTTEERRQIASLLLPFSVAEREVITQQAVRLARREDLIAVHKGCVHVHGAKDKARMHVVIWVVPYDPEAAADAERPS